MFVVITLAVCSEGFLERVRVARNSMVALMPVHIVVISVLKFFPFARL